MGVLKLLERTAASVATPSAGKNAVFFDSADGLPKYRDDAGVLHVVTDDATLATELADVDTRGRQAIYVPAAAIRPSVTGGCGALTAIASAANQPDIVTLNFDPTTQEYAQFSLVM